MNLDDVASVTVQEQVVDIAVNTIDVEIIEEPVVEIVVVVDDSTVVVEDSTGGIIEVIMAEDLTGEIVEIISAGQQGIPGLQNVWVGNPPPAPVENDIWIQI